jgi:predicted RNA-binding protein with PIN domain
MPYLIDGYNVIYADDELAQFMKDGLLEQAREKLLRLLVQFKAATGHKVSVIFDGSSPYGGLPVDARMGIRMIFSRKPEKADDIIMEEIVRETNPGQLIVVSSDREIQKEALEFKARTLDAHSFLDLMQSTLESKTEHKPVEPGQKYGQPIAQSEIDEWMEIFGDLNED